MTHASRIVTIKNSAIQAFLNKTHGFFTRFAPLRLRPRGVKSKVNTAQGSGV
jgi:hypothetical protein